jgi:hypothetical protein
MSSSYFDAIFWGILNHHDTFLFITCAFENQVVAFWLLNSDHLFDILISRLIAYLDIPWKLSSTDLAFELGEVVMLRSSYDFLLDFDSDPFGKTFEVH